MKIKVSIVILLLFASVSITYAIHKTIPAETTLKVPGADAEAVYNYITALDPYDKWETWPGKKRQYKARPPLQFVTTYVDRNAMFSIRKGHSMIDSSFIVTENYDENKKLTAIFVMYKIKDFNPSAGDWYWAQYDPRGKATVSGNVKACIECHTKEKNNDYIFTEKFVK